MKYIKYFLISLLLVGCTPKIVPELQIHINSPVGEYETEVITDALFASFDTLLNCQYLLEEHPDKWGKLVELQNSITVQYNFKYKEESNYCAFAFLNNNDIYLHPNFFYMKEGCRPREVIAHEILHLIGFTHDEDKEGCADFYKVFNMCVFKIYR